MSSRRNNNGRRIAERNGEYYISEMTNKSEVILNEKRARFDALPSPEVSSDDVRGIWATGGGDDDIIEWVMSKGVLGRYKNNDTGMDNITINEKSVRAVIHHKAKAGKVALLETVPDLIKNGIFLETNPKNTRGLISHIFAAKATIDGVDYAVSYVVREDNNGRRYYDHSLTKIEALDCIDSQAPAFTSESATGSLPKEIKSPDIRPSTIPASEESTAKILKKHLAIKSKLFKTVAHLLQGAERSSSDAYT